MTMPWAAKNTEARRQKRDGRDRLLVVMRPRSRPIGSAHRWPSGRRRSPTRDALAWTGLRRRPAVDAPAPTVRDPAQLLHVDVDQLAGVVASRYAGRPDQSPGRIQAVRRLMRRGAPAPGAPSRRDPDDAAEASRAELAASGAGPRSGARARPTSGCGHRRGRLERSTSPARRRALDSDATTCGPSDARSFIDSAALATDQPASMR